MTNNTQPQAAIILMSSYCGEKYIAEQIESIRQQSFVHWQLWIRDDGSQDRTVEIIKDFVGMDSRIKFVTDNDNLANVGAAQSFGALMACAQQKTVGPAHDTYYFFL